MIFYSFGFVASSTALQASLNLSLYLFVLLFPCHVILLLGLECIVGLGVNLLRLLRDVLHPHRGPQQPVLIIETRKGPSSASRRTMPTLCKGYGIMPIMMFPNFG